MSNEHRHVLVFVEQREGILQRVSLELLGKARKLADYRNQEVIAVLLGDQVKEMVDELYHYGADQVILTDDPALKVYMTEPYTKVVSEVIRSHKPEICMFGATAIGRDLAPRIAARIQTGLTADCTSLEIDEDTQNLLMTRPAFGGNIMATIICPDHYPQMSTVRPGVMQLMEKDNTRQGQLIEFESDLSGLSEGFKILEIVKTIKEKKNIEDANILISAGRGIGSQENLKLLEDLADSLGGVVSASRAIVDQGWMDRNFQVGQTGKTVRPDLYIACGISGAIQHLAGMEESDLIIAINKDPNAPIFDVADIGIVGDLKKVLPELTKLMNLEITTKAI
ncbi:MAG: electron transfer flavoprotein subunit alpha/FixB family protein [Clostridiales bacterium]|nr:electron transfer flavoprotein subunit alpha/FixB family protein [Clostridiales bacterium]